MSNKILAGLSLVFLGMIISCGYRNGSVPITGQEQNSPELQVSTLDEGQFDTLINNRNGRLLLINVWATWCMPCREEFPDLVKLAGHYRGSPVDIVGISADYPDEIDSRILPFLTSQKVRFPVYVQTFNQQDAFINHLNADWQGALPATFIYALMAFNGSFSWGNRPTRSFAGQ